MKRYDLLHYMGQYLLLIFIVPIGKKIYFSDFPINQKVGPIIIKSKTDTKFNTKSKPILIAHFTDTHINSFNPKYGQNFENSLIRSLIYKPDILIHTGDIVDNFCSDTRPKYGHQCRNDSTSFNQIYHKYKKFYKTSLASAGNHDMFGVYSFNSTNFNFLRTIRSSFDNKITNYEEFLVSNHKVKFQGEFSPINFISLNPFTFPTAHPVMMYFAHTWRDFLDRLETVISTVPTAEKIVFYSHYPQSSFTSITNPPSSQLSTSGKTITELIELPNTIAFLSGHTHPKSQAIEHHGLGQIEGEIIGYNSRYLEVIGTDVKVGNKFNIISIDNDRVISHQIGQKDQKKCFVTYPVPWNQTTSGDFIDDERSLLRILCFSDEKLRISIHGDLEIESIEKVRQIKENVYLYEQPLRSLFRIDRKNANSRKKAFASHRLTFGGDWSGELEFYSDGVIPDFREDKNHEYSRVLVARFALIVIVFYLFFVTVPVSSSWLKKEEELYFHFLRDNSNQKDAFKNWFLTVTGLCLRLKIQRLHGIYRSVLFLSVVWPIFLPLSLSETEGHFGFISSYGYFCGGVFRYSEHGQDYALYYYIFVVFPVVLASASLASYIPLFGLGGLEIVFLFGFAATYVYNYVMYYKLAESAGPFCKYVSVYTLGMIVLFPLLIFSYVKLFLRMKNGRNSEWYSEGLTLIRSIPI